MDNNVLKPFWQVYLQHKSVLLNHIYMHIHIHTHINKAQASKLKARKGCKTNDLQRVFHRFFSLYHHKAKYNNFRSNYISYYLFKSYYDKWLPTCSCKLSGQLNICKLKICPKWTLKSELIGRVTVLDTSLELKRTFINADRFFTSSRRKTSAL